MLEKRIIPALLLIKDELVKTTKFRNPKYIGDPINTVKLFNDKEADELVIYDINASKDKSSPNFSLLNEIATEAFMPLTYGGGISTLEDIETIFKLGFEKVSLGYKGEYQHELIKKAVKLFGAQSIVITIDIKKAIFGEVFAYNRITKKKISSVPNLITVLEHLGIGEIVLNFIYKDGTCDGFDCENISKFCSDTILPIIALGGAWTNEHLSEGMKTGVQGLACGSKFIYHGNTKGIIINYPKRDTIEKIIKNKEN